MKKKASNEIKAKLDTVGFIMSHLVKHPHISPVSILASVRAFVYMCKVQRSQSQKTTTVYELELEYRRLQYEV